MAWQREAAGKAGNAAFVSSGITKGKPIPHNGGGNPQLVPGSSRLTGAAFSCSGVFGAHDGGWTQGPASWVLAIHQMPRKGPHTVLSCRYFCQISAVSPELALQGTSGDTILWFTSADRWVRTVERCRQYASPAAEGSKDTGTCDPGCQPEGPRGALGHQQACLPTLHGDSLVPNRDP